MKKFLFIFLITVSQFGFTTSTTDVNVLLTDNESEFGAEFLEALRFAYDNGLTRFKEVESFRPYDVLTREQAAKIVGVFAERVMKYPSDQTRECQFKDIELSDETLEEHIINACKLGIFGGTSEGYYHPLKALTKAEALTIVVRMFNQGYLDETVEPRYLNYYLEARELDLTKEKNIHALDRPLTRYEMVLLLYRFNLKYTLLEKIQNGPIQQSETNIGIRSVGNKVLVIDSSLFLDEDVENIYAEIDGAYYRLHKSSLVSQFEDVFTRYGNLYSITEEQVDNGEEGSYVGVTAFNLINEVVTDGNIRPIELQDWYYDIQLSDIKPFYQIQRVIVNGEDEEITESATGSVVGTGN